MTSISFPCQGLQSCLEQQLPEHRVLMNKLSNMPSQEAEVEVNEEVGVQCNEFLNQHDNNVDVDIGGWSFLQTLGNYPKKDDSNNEVYVHPSSSSSSTLSVKSLEMCTESLGSETGSDTSENIEEYSHSLPERRSKYREMAKKHNMKANFPPPLTSINGVQVRPHREGGRLVLKATAITSYMSCFHVERGDGRLKLSLLNQEVENDEEAEDQENVDEMRNGSRKLGRPRKCKESGSSRIKGIPSWEPFWVAIT